MNIGIITQPLHTNYGGLLQNYALQQTLKRLGHKSITLDQDFSYPSPYIICLSCLKTFILRLLGKDNNRLYYWEIKLLRRNTEHFINKYINRTQKINKLNEFRECVINRKLDAIIVGSDQVWRPKYCRNILNSFLDFTTNIEINRIAYAASFGVDYWEFTEEQTFKVKELIKCFDAVSVREDSGLNLCKEYLECDALHVLDPTMLLDKEDYINLVQEEKEPSSRGELFVYILDNSTEKQEIIKDVASALSLTPFTSMPQNKVETKNLESSVFPPVTQWLRSFMDAKFVLCDSFHGAVFSIIFNKPFLIIGNKERGMSRFDSLLRMFGLENRMTDVDYPNLSVINVPIDWTKVNRKREALKNKSIDFIKECLK